MNVMQLKSASCQASRDDAYHQSTSHEDFISSQSASSVKNEIVLVIWYDHKLEYGQMFFKLYDKMSRLANSRRVLLANVRDVQTCVPLPKKKLRTLKKYYQDLNWTKVRPIKILFISLFLFRRKEIVKWHLHFHSLTVGIVVCRANLCVIPGRLHAHNGIIPSYSCHATNKNMTPEQKEMGVFFKEW